jgi:O-antigen/teichoic acid export membrane protein
MAFNGLFEIRSLGRRGEGETTFRTNVVSTFFFQVLQLFSYVGSTAVIARWLGPEGKGTVALALLIPGMLGIFLGGGINVANVYFAGSRKLDVSVLTENSVKFAFFSTFLGVFAVGILMVAGWLPVLVPGISQWIIMLAMIGLPSGLLCGHFSGILQGLQRIITINIVNFVQSMLTLVLTILLVLVLRIGLLGALLSYIAPGIVSLLIFAILLRREGGLFYPRWDPSIMRSVLSFGLKGYIGNVFQFFNYRLDAYFVNYFVGTGGVGIYSVSVGLAELLWYFPNAVGFVIFPKAAATQPEVMNIFTPRIFFITLAVTTLGAIGLVFLGKPLIQFIYSLAFVSAYIPMLVLLPGVILLGGAKVLTNEIAGRGYPHYNSFTSAVAFILTVLFDLIFIPRFGIMGAALASSIAYGTIFFIAIGFYFIVSRRTTEVSTEVY